jgi:CheY-like chemotaxis protein
MSVNAPVLIIDDDDDVRDLLTDIVQQAGYPAIGAASGEEGLMQAHLQTPRMVILDILLPEMDGWHVLSLLRSDPPCAEVPVLVVSVTDPAAAGHSVQGHVVKPFSGQELRDAVQALVGPPPQLEATP